MASLTTVVLSLPRNSSESSETFLIFGKLVEHLVQSPIHNQFSQGIHKVSQLFHFVYLKVDLNELKLN